jgi:hypothetical protein
MPGAIGVKKDNIIPRASVEQSDIVVAETIADINTARLWYAAPERRSLPWWLFQLFLLLPCLYLAYPFVLERGIMLTGNSARLVRWRAFRQARKQIEQAIKNSDDTQLYAIFMQLLAELDKDEESLRQDVFFERIMHAAYGKSDSKNSDELCGMAKQWLDRLQRLI